MGTSALILALAILSESAVCSNCPCKRCGDDRPPVKSSAPAAGNNFVIRRGSTKFDAADLLKHAEAKREVLCSQWLGADAARDKWSPPCELILHTSRASYVRAVGTAGQTTSGSTLVRISEGKVVVRRINLLIDASGKHYDTLSHELVHAIFAERFPRAVPPRWAEEGAALLADPEQKRLAHREDFAYAHRAGQTFAVRELLRMTDYPAPQRFPEFYGQSLVLVEFLTSLGEPPDFVRFVARSMETDIDRALQEVYGLSSASQLEGRWTKHAGEAADAFAAQ